MDFGPNSKQQCVSLFQFFQRFLLSLRREFVRSVTCSHDIPPVFKDRISTILAKSALFMVKAYPVFSFHTQSRSPVLIYWFYSLPELKSISGGIPVNQGTITMSPSLRTFHFIRQLIVSKRNSEPKFGLKSLYNISALFLIHSFMNVTLSASSYLKFSTNLHFLQSVYGYTVLVNGHVTALHPGGAVAIFVFHVQPRKKEKVCFYTNSQFVLFSLIVFVESASLVLGMSSLNRYVAFSAELPRFWVTVLCYRSLLSLFLIVRVFLSASTHLPMRVAWEKEVEDESEGARDDLPAEEGIAWSTVGDRRRRRRAPAIITA